MISRDFKVNRKKFEDRKLTILQHKLRPTMKAYTILDFKLDEENKKYTFRKTFMRKRIRLEDKTVSTGIYEIFDTPDADIIKVRLTII